MHKSQIFLYFILVFIAGVATASLVSWPYWVDVVLIGTGMFLVILFWRRWWPLVVVGIALVLFICGALRYEAFKLDQGILTQFADKKVQVTLVGYIKDQPTSSDDKQAIVVAVKQLIVPNYTLSVDENVQLTAKPYPSYHYGQTIEIVGNLNTPKIERRTSYKNYLAKDGIFTTMLYPSISETPMALTWGQRSRIGVLSGIFKLKTQFERSLNRSLSQPSSSFVSGILLGSKSQIPKPLLDAFARTSLTHVLAISGYNVTIIAELVMACLLYLMRRQRAFWVTLAIILGFTIMTGAQASVVRAALMGSLVLLARNAGRFYNVKNAVALAAAMMIFINPLVLSYDVGFQLSFAATLGLIFLSPKLEALFGRLAKNALTDTLIMTISAQIFVLPLLLYYFGSLSLIALPANLLLLPTIPVSMLLGFLTGIAGLILPILGQLVGYFAWALAALQLAVVSWLATPSWAAIAVVFSWPMVLASYLFLGYLIFGDKLFKRKSVKT